MDNGRKYDLDGQPVEVTKNFYRLYIAIACFAAGAVLFALAIGLSYVVQGISVYLLIASLISELAAVTFINAQKKHGESKLCMVFKILSYIVMGAGLIIFTVGTGVNIGSKK